MNIAIPIFDRLTALDAVGPVRGALAPARRTVSFIAQPKGPKRTETGMLALTADLRSTNCPSPRSSSCPAGRATVPLMRRRGVPGLAPACPPALAVDDLGVHRVARAGRCRDPRRPRRDDALAPVDALAALGANPVQERVVRAGQGDHRRRGLGRHRHGTDPRRARSPERNMPRPSSWGSSTTRSRPSRGSSERCPPRRLWPACGARPTSWPDQPHAGPAPGRGRRACRARAPRICRAGRRPAANT